jgi:autoinducer 2-degrading protein
MFGKFFRVKINPSKRNDFIHFMKIDALVAETKEPGTLRFDLYEDPTEASAFFVYEAYTNIAAFEAHKEHEPYKLWESWIEKDIIIESKVVFEGVALCALTIGLVEKEAAVN